MKTGTIGTVMSLILAIILSSQVEGSAIPMWEFLSKEEKMSHLYRLFSKQVATYCQDSSMPDCNKNLLVSGRRHLANMDDNELNDIDPYQRGADNIIWRALIGDDRLTSRPGQGSIDSYYNEADPIATSESDHNDLAEESAPQSDYVRPPGYAGPYLMGPMVIRVFPDGRPVPGDEMRPLPQDEDLEDLRYTKVPSVSEIQTKADRIFYKKPYSLIKRSSLDHPINQRIHFITKNHFYRANPFFLRFIQ